MKRAIGLGTVSLLVCINRGVGAEQDAQLMIADAMAAESVLITASRMAVVSKGDVPLLEIPQNIQSLSADLIQSQGATILDDVLRNVAGVMPGGYYQSWDYFRIRGFDASGYIYLDSLAYDSGVQFNVELYGLDRVEIIKGPASALYGSGSLGGLVNLVSKRPTSTTFLTAGASYGSFESYDLHIDGGTTLLESAGVDGRLVAVQRHAGTFTDFAKGNDRTYVAPSAAWRIGDNTDLTVLASFQHDRINMGFPLTYVGAVVASPFGRYPLDTYTGEPGRSNMADGDRYAVGYEFRHRFNDVLSFAQNLRYAYNANTWDHIMYSAYLDADQRTLYRYPYSTEAYWTDFGIDTRLQAEFETGPFAHTLMAGVDYFKYRGRWHPQEIDYGDPAAYMPLDLYNPVYGAPFPAFATVSNVRELVRDTGIYVQEHIKFDSLTLTMNGRWDFAETGSSWAGPFAPHKDDAFVPRIGATYAILPETVVYGSYSESFLPQGGSAFSGASLEPEAGQQWEAGIKASILDERLTFTASLFQLTRQNVATDDPLHPGFSVQTGEQRSRGFELDAQIAPAPGWLTRLSYAYIDAEVTKDNSIPVGDRPQNAPPTSVGLWSQYDFVDGPMRNLQIGGGVYHYSSQTGDLPNTFELPPYTLVNAMLRYDFGRFALRLNANNIFDARYFTGSYNDVYVQPGEPRSYMLTLKWRL